jgi:hypothetical protein
MVSCRQEPSEAAAQGQDSVSHIVPEVWPNELSLDAHPHEAIAMQHVAMRFLTATRRPTTVAACNGLFRRHKASGISLNFVAVLNLESSRGYGFRVKPKVMNPTKVSGPCSNSFFPLPQLLGSFRELDTASL